MAGLFEDQTAQRIMDATRVVEGDRGNQPRAKNLRHPRRNSPQTILLAQAVSAVTAATSVFNVDNISLIQGVDPRADTTSMSETLEVKNTFSMDLDANELVRAEQNIDGDWETILPGEGGTSEAGQSTSVFSFKLTFDKTATSGSVNARLIDENGVDLVPIVPQETVADEAARLAMAVGAAPGEVEVDDNVKQSDTDTIWRYDGTDPSDVANWTNMGPASVDIVAIDKRVNATVAVEPGLIGYTSYTDCFGEDQVEFLGECRNVGVANYGGTGKPAYEIISMEGLAQSLLVKFKEKPSGSGNPISVEVIEIFGSNYCQRPPKGIQPSSTFEVFDGNELADNGEINDVWLAERSHESDQYVIVAQSTGLRSYADYDNTKNQLFGHNSGVLTYSDRGTAAVRFRLNADLGLTATSVAATLLNDDGSATATTITLTDSLGVFTGYGPYTDTEDASQAGFEGTAIEYETGGQTRYYIVDIERLYPDILVELNEEIDTGTGGVEADFKKGFGNSYRIPKRSSAGVMLTYNTDNLADGARNPSTWVAHYDPAADRYELVSVGWMEFAKDLPDFDAAKSRQNLIQEYGDLKWGDRDGTAVAIVSTEIPAASGSLGSFTAGVGVGKTTTVSGATYTAEPDEIVIHNFSKTLIRASTTDPIYLAGSLLGDVLVIGSVMDLSGLPNFVKGNPPSGGDDPSLQIPYHQGGLSDFRLDSSYCGA